MPAKAAHSTAKLNLFISAETSRLRLKKEPVSTRRRVLTGWSAQLQGFFNLCKTRAEPICLARNLAHARILKFSYYLLRTQYNPKRLPMRNVIFTKLTWYGWYRFLLRRQHIRPHYIP